ncbi:MAG: hypothetical protein H0X27_13755 [Caulobacteraceae bacterium]|nr:hypothetical protein [Caulobacteraceae bacterium]
MSFVNGAPYRHIGGAVIGDHGPIALAEVRALAGFYEREAGLNQLTGAAGAAEICGLRARVLRAALEAADRWRRAAGWRDPEAADRASSYPFRPLAGA